MPLRKGRRPATADSVNRPHAVSQAGGLRDCEATLRPIALQSVYDGRTCIGFIFSRGKLGYEGFTVDDVSLGVFPTAKAAADAISEVAS
jgi:hypothetical protein